MEREGKMTTMLEQLSSPGDPDATFNPPGIVLNGMFSCAIAPELLITVRHCSPLSEWEEHEKPD